MIFFAMTVSATCISAIIDPVLAANVIKSSKSDCSIELSGQIDSGDYAKLFSLAKTLGLLEPADSGEPSNSINQAICLNSPGGNYLEGRLISQLLRDHGIATRVPEFSECFSSCAFIFMAGRLLGAESDRTSRHLHINGKLGFHAPYIVPDETKSFSGADLSRQVTLTNKLIADFIRFGSDTSPYSGRPFFPISLIAKLLAASPDEVVLVETVQDAALWQIEIYGMREIMQLTENNLRQACANFLSWELDRESEEISLEWPYLLNYEKGSLYRESVVWAVVNTGNMDSQECRLQVTEKASKGFVMCSIDEGNGIIRGDCAEGWGFWVPWYYGLSPAQPLNSILQ